jgi:hypothetical protein
MVSGILYPAFVHSDVEPLHAGPQEVVAIAAHRFVEERQTRRCVHSSSLCRPAACVDCPPSILRWIDRYFDLWKFRRHSTHRALAPLSQPLRTLVVRDLLKLGQQPLSCSHLILQSDFHPPVR